MGEPIAAGQFKVRLLSAVAAAVVAALAMTLLQPAGASRQAKRERKAALVAAQQLADNVTIQEEFPALARFGALLAKERVRDAERVGISMLADPSMDDRIAAIFAAAA